MLSLELHNCRSSFTYATSKSDKTSSLFDESKLQVGVMKTLPISLQKVLKINET